MFPSEVVGKEQGFGLGSLPGELVGQLTEELK